MRAVMFLRIVAACAALSFTPAALATGPESVSKLAAQLVPAVVNISSSKYVGPNGEPYPTAPDGSPPKDLLDGLNPNAGQGPDEIQQAQSLGSGFLISADGLIVTNNHVIDGASEIDVVLSDGTRLAAKLVGADDKADLAVIKVTSKQKLPFVSFGDSDTALVGDWVMAIGNPFGLGGSVSLGIVSARDRDIQTGPYDDFIQTDAAINAGNSGGPLFDMNGDVVGINTAIIARGGSSLGIGFAVPGNLAKPIVDQLSHFGETRRGWLGVGISDVTDDIAASLGRPNTYGALVVDVAKNGPSFGVVQQGDIILKFDGKDVTKLKDLTRFAAAAAVGKAVPVVVLREGQEVTLSVTLGRLESGEKQLAALQDSGVQDDTDSPTAPVPQVLKDIVGFDIAALDAEARKTYKVAGEAKGVVITDVTKGSDAERHGLLVGMVISEVNQQKVQSVDELSAKVDAAREAGRPSVLFKVTDPAGESRFVPVKLN